MGITVRSKIAHHDLTSEATREGRQHWFHLSFYLWSFFPDTLQVFRRNIVLVDFHHFREDWKLWWSLIQVLSDILFNSYLKKFTLLSGKNLLCHNKIIILSSDWLYYHYSRKISLFATYLWQTLIWVMAHFVVGQNCCHCTWPPTLQYQMLISFILLLKVKESNRNEDFLMHLVYFSIIDINLPKKILYL